MHLRRSLLASLALLLLAAPAAHAETTLGETSRATPVTAYGDLTAWSAYDEARIPMRFADVHLWQKPYSEPALVEDLRRLCEGLRAGRQPLAGTASNGHPP